jgi:ADP-ribose pyrophosphatase YjhB (NUDIX family)
MNPWEMCGVKSSDDWSSLAFIRVYADDVEIQEGTSPVGYVLVIQENMKSKGVKPLWKLPGGHKEPDENPLDTVQREVLGETYLSPQDVSYTYLVTGGTTKAGRSWKWCYFIGRVALSKTRGMCEYHPGNEGERPQYFTVAEFYRLVHEGKVLPAHLRVLRENHLI